MDAQSFEPDLPRDRGWEKCILRVSSFWDRFRAWESQNSGDSRGEAVSNIVAD